MIAREKLIDIVGSANVSDDGATLASYSKDLSFVNTTRPACVVRPQNAAAGEAAGRRCQRDRHSAGPGQLGPASFQGRHGAERRRRDGRRPVGHEEDHQRRQAPPGRHGRTRCDLRRTDTGRREAGHQAQPAPRSQSFQERGRQSARPGAGGHAQVSVGHLRPVGVHRGDLRHGRRLPHRAGGRPGDDRGTMGGRRHAEGAVRATRAFLAPARPGSAGDHGHRHLGLAALRAAPQSRRALRGRLLPARTTPRDGGVARQTENGERMLRAFEHRSRGSVRRRMACGLQPSEGRASGVDSVLRGGRVRVLPRREGRHLPGRDNHHHHAPGRGTRAARSQAFPLATS